MAGRCADDHLRLTCHLVGSVPGREPQGYAFIEFYDEKDAEYARRKLDRERLNGREIAVIYAKVSEWPC